MREELVGNRYTWGDLADQYQANCRGKIWKDQWHRVSSVGSFPANGFGLYDTSEDVWKCRSPIGFATQTCSYNRPICLPTKVTITKNDVFYEVDPGMTLKVVVCELLFV